MGSSETLPSDLLTVYRQSTLPSDVRRFVRRFRVNYPVLLGTRDAKALFTEAETLPMTVVIDREGNVRELIEGILLPEEFEEKVKLLLR